MRNRNKELMCILCRTQLMCSLFLLKCIHSLQHFEMCTVHVLCCGIFVQCPCCHTSHTEPGKQANRSKLEWNTPAKWIALACIVEKCSVVWGEPYCARGACRTEAVLLKFQVKSGQKQRGPTPPPRSSSSTPQLTPPPTLPLCLENIQKLQFFVPNSNSFSETVSLF